MDEEDFLDFLMLALERATSEDGAPVLSLRTFRGAGLLTANKGIVVGAGEDEFQITIVQSRRSELALESDE